MATFGPTGLIHSWRDTALNTFPPVSDEQTVAEAVAPEIVARGFASSLGRRETHDASSPDLLRVDFLFPEARTDSPHLGLALEVTSLSDPVRRALGPRWVRLADELSTAARAAGLPRWTLTFSFNHDWRQALPLIVRHLVNAQGAGGTLPGPAIPGVSGLRPTHDPWGGPEYEPYVEVYAEVEYGPLPRQILDETVAANIAKLEQARPAATHLAVTSTDWEINTADLPSVQLPDDVDVLWLIAGITTDGRMAGWYTTGGAWFTVTGDPE